MVVVVVCVWGEMGGNTNKEDKFLFFKNKEMQCYP